MKSNDVMDTSGSYTYGLDLSKIKLDMLKSSAKQGSALKRYVCIDLEMTEFQAGQHSFVPGTNGEVIQFGAVMLDEKFNMISKFSSYVKPAYSSITPRIQELTGITDKNLEGADDFLSVFDKFSYWRGEGDITTFCWSKMDHSQLWSELEAKASHRYDLFACLKNFVDLQKIFGKLVASKVSVSLESAMRLLQMDYKGRIHTAYCDSFNTARILHKLFCTESLNLDFDYINPDEQKEKKQSKSIKDNYNCSIASFMSPELLAQFGYTADDNTEKADDAIICTEYEEVKNEKSQSTIDEDFIENDEIKGLCAKYKIPLNKWAKLVKQVKETKEMIVS